MKKLEWKPDDDIIRKTLIEDNIKRNTDLMQMISIIKNIGDGYSVALNSRWGAGKTFFVKQMKIVLDSYNPSTTTYLKNDDIKKIHSKFHFDCSEPYLTVYYDAWKNDNDVDPILSILYSIVQDGIGDLDEFKQHNYGNIFCELIDLFSNAYLDSGFGALTKSFSKTDLLFQIKNEKVLINKKLKLFLKQY